MKEIKRGLSVFIAIIMIITTFSGMIGVSAVESLNGLPVSDNMLSQHILGGSVLDYNFTNNSSELVGTSPEGWIHDYAYPTLLWCDPNASDYAPKAPIYQNWDLRWGSNGWTYALTLPALGVENYSATINLVMLGGGSFGLITGIPTDYTTTKEMNTFTFAQGNYGIEYDHSFEIGTRIETKKYGTYADNHYAKIEPETAKNYFITYNDGQDNYDLYDYTYYTDVKLTVNRVNGVSYYYVNDILVGSMEDIGLNEGLLDRIAIAKTSGSPMKILSLNVTEIIPARAGDTIISEDFSDMNVGDTLPEGWLHHYYKGLSIEYGSYRPTNVSVCADENNQKYLSMGNADGCQMVTLPALGTENYIVNAKMMYNGDAYPYCSIGILTDILNDYANTQVFTISAVKGDDKHFSVRTRRKNANSTGSGYTNDPFGIGTGLLGYYDENGTVENGDLFDLTVVHYNNVSYFYVNGRYVSSVKDLNTTELSDRIALWVYDAYDTRIYSVDVKKISGIPQKATKAEDFERSGDINGDKKTDILDLIAMKKMAVRLGGISFAADMNFDGRAADAKDLSMLVKRLLGKLNTKFYVLKSDEAFDKINMQGRFEKLPMGVTLDWSASSLEFALL